MITNPEDVGLFNPLIRKYTDAAHAAGAVAITLMFVFASVPMMERRLLSERAGYAEYQANTPMLVPWPRRGPTPAGAEDRLG